MRTPSLPQYRLIVASVILAMWVMFHVIDAFAGTDSVTPFVDAAAGAIVTWLFGWPVLHRGDDE